MTQIKRRLGDYVSSAFLNSQDVTGNEGPAVITGVAEREVTDDKKPGGKRLAVMITFDRWPDKGYDCNATNIRVLQDMLGDDVCVDDLRGVRVFLTTHQTNFGRGILFQPPQDSIHDASAAARQKIAEARARESAAESERYQPAPPVSMRLEHSHGKDTACTPNNCDVSRAIQLGNPVDEVWPASPAFVPKHQPAPPSEASERFANEPIPAPTDEEIPF